MGPIESNAKHHIAPAAATSDADPRAKRISRVERLALDLHRGLDKWLTPLGISMIRRTNGAVGDSRLARRLGAWREVDVLLLTTRGRRSGRERTVVLQFFPDGEAMIVTAANDGGRQHPGWYFNLRHDPSASVEVSGRTIGVRAEELPEGDAATWWGRIVSRDPGYQRYARATSRPFPIIRLTPTSQRSG